MIPKDTKNSAFEQLLEKTKPAQKPYIIPAAGLGLEFKAVQNRREWDDLINQARTRSESLKGEGVAADQFKSLTRMHRAQVIALAKLMTGVYSVLDPETGKPQSKKEPPFTVAAWLQLCEERPSVFDSIYGAVDAAQSGALVGIESEEIAAAGEDSGATSPTETD